MSFFRNPEIKKYIMIFTGVSLICILVGFLISISCGVFVGIVCILMNSIFLLLTKNRYQRIANMSLEIDRILHGEDRLNMDFYKEGELAILQDEIYKMVIRLQEQAEMLQTDKRFLADSLADISHQIRTPLTSLNLIAAMLKKSDITQQRRIELVQEMTVLLENTNWLISTLLKISRLDANTVELKREKVKISDLVEKVKEMFLIPMEVKEQAFIVRMKGNETFFGDLSWTIEALSNVVKNCIEHTPAGGSIIVSSMENPLYTEILIEDNGSGIDQEDLPHLFERFYRGKNTKEQSYGIGLALARMIISNQNGIIKAENREERGTRFIIRFYKGAV